VEVFLATVALDNLTARTLDNLCSELGIHQISLSKGAGTAQGTVSNFLRGKPIRWEKAKSILKALSAIAELLQLDDGQRTAVRETIARAEGTVSRHAAANLRIGRTNSSWTPSDLFMVIMSLTDEPRLNLTKSFDYRSRPHFLAHVECVARGITYQWVAYENESLESDWNTYTEDLGKTLYNEHRQELRDQLRKKNIERAKDVQRFLEERVECHVLPSSAQELGQRIPFRITVFSNAVCLCSEEQTAHSYHQGGQYFVLPTEEIKDLQTALQALFVVCPPVEKIRTGTAPNTEVIRQYHDKLRSSFLQALIKKVSV
jgi:hypothetical protein